MGDGPKSKNGRHVALIKVKFGMGHHVKFHLYWAKMWEYSPKTVKISNFGHINLLLRGDSFAQFLQNSRHFYASIGSF